jgi:hypothetical protein
MSVGDWFGVIGTVSGWGIAFWQWRTAKAQGSLVTIFLYDLKSADLPSKALEQVNDMLARLDPAKSNSASPDFYTRH